MYIVSVCVSLTPATQPIIELTHTETAHTCIKKVLTKSHFKNGMIKGKKIIFERWQLYFGFPGEIIVSMYTNILTNNRKCARAKSTKI